uniref:Uncharacterized protein n=1 Tax=Anguilla anguilla TaxID=7936 RepID=A0A0E9QUG9_ANGAN
MANLLQIKMWVYSGSQSFPAFLSRLMA